MPPQKYPRASALFGPITSLSQASLNKVVSYLRLEIGGLEDNLIGHAAQKAAAVATVARLQGELQEQEEDVEDIDEAVDEITREIGILAGDVAEIENTAATHSLPVIFEGPLQVVFNGSDATRRARLEECLRGEVRALEEIVEGKGVDKDAALASIVRLKRELQEETAKIQDTDETVAETKKEIDFMYGAIAEIEVVSSPPDASSCAVLASPTPRTRRLRVALEMAEFISIRQPSATYQRTRDFLLPQACPGVGVKERVVSKGGVFEHGKKSCCVCFLKIVGGVEHRYLFMVASDKLVDLNEQRGVDTTRMIDHAKILMLGIQTANSELGTSFAKIDGCVGFWVFVSGSRRKMVSRSTPTDGRLDT